MQSGILRHQANSISANILHQLKDERQGFVNAVSSVEHRIMEAVEKTTTPDIIDEGHISAPSVNSVATDNVMIEVLKLLKEIKDDAKDNKRKQNNDSNNNRHRNHNKENEPNNNRNRNSSQRNRSTNYQGAQDKKKPRYDVSKYCWSCGGTNHPSKHCKRRQPGHKEEATFKNKMSGSTEFCQPI